MHETTARPTTPEAAHAIVHRQIPCVPSAPTDNPGRVEFFCPNASMAVANVCLTCPARPLVPLDNAHSVKIMVKDLASNKRKRAGKENAKGLVIFCLTP